MYRYLSTSRGAGNTVGVGFGVGVSLYRYLSTSRGAGNLKETKYQHEIHQYRYLSTSQGAGKFFSYKYGIFLKNYISSREAGNAFTAFLAKISTIVVTPIYLARGRKQVALKVLVQSVIRIAPYLPREGPETKGIRFLLQCRSV